MTIQQEAYSLIDTLSEDKVKLIVQVMISMLPERKTNYYPSQTEAASKMMAFNEMQKLRCKSSEYGIKDIDTELHTAIEEKYGKYMHSGELV